MDKVYYISKLSIEECYILKELEFTYILMTCEVYDSRPWGDPPYWKNPNQLNRNYYHFIADKKDVKMVKDAECYNLQLKKITYVFIKIKNSLEDEIEGLNNEKELLMDEFKEIEIKLVQKIKELENG